MHGTHRSCAASYFSAEKLEEVPGILPEPLYSSDGKVVFVNEVSRELLTDYPRQQGKVETHHNVCCGLSVTQTIRGRILSPAASLSLAATSS